MGDLYTFLGLSDSEGSGDEEQAPVRQTKKQRKQEAEEPQQDKKKKSKGKDAAAKEDKADARTSREEAAKKIADRKALLNAQLDALKPAQTVYVGNLSFDVTEEQLREHFQKEAGDVATVLLPRNNSGRPGGYGYIEFTTSDWVPKALTLNGHTLTERPMYVSRYKATRRNEMQSDRAEKPKQMRKNRALRKEKIKAQVDAGHGGHKKEKRKRNSDD